ncbi:MAG: M48 family metallopeptidase [Polyangiaceae bacterium]|nr:M48 family metallopeptidase [Polyangiaceae bacterium]
MATVSNLDFRAFVSDRERSRPGAVGGEPHGYAFAWDRSTRAAFARAAPLELAVSAGVRVFEHLERARLLGQAVKVGPRQFPRVLRLAESCAETLGIPVPAIYVVSSPVLNAATFGTRDACFVLVHSALVDHLTDEELQAVLGHECGHVHNDHVVYLTALHALGRVAGSLAGWVALPAVFALRAWSRRAEVTSDRAAALCARDLAVAERALTKLALGSQKLYEQLDVEAFLSQHEEAQDSVGRFGELLSSHPWLPKRVLALREFGRSALYRRHAGLGDDGASLAEVDERVRGLIRVVGG